MVCFFLKVLLSKEEYKYISPNLLPWAVDTLDVSLNGQYFRFISIFPHKQEVLPPKFSAFSEKLLFIFLKVWVADLASGSSNQCI